MSLRIPKRLFFQKVGRLKYISHLDTMRTFSRALSRSGLPFWHTEGFNPHVFLSFTLSLSLGYEGLRESFSVYLLENHSNEDIQQKINQYLPADLSIVEVATPIQKEKDVKWAKYHVELRYDLPAEQVIEALTNFFSQKEILAEKKSKRGAVQIDLRASVKEEQFAVREDGILLELLLSAGTDFNINPRVVLETFSKFFAPPKHTAYTRVNFYDSSGATFL